MILLNVFWFGLEFALVFKLIKGSASMPILATQTIESIERYFYLLLLII
jgi:hypothetical protein